MEKAEVDFGRRAGCVRSDPALEAPAGRTGERRRHARLYRRWRAMLDGRRLPARSEWERVAGGERESVLFEIGADGQGGPRCRYSTTLEQMPWLDAVLGRIAERLPAVLVAQAPLACEAEIVGGDAATVLLRALLLPLGDAEGAPRYVEAALGWTIAADDRAIGIAPRFADVGSGSSRSAGETSDHCLATARAWAAVAGERGALNPMAFASAMSAAFDALLLGGSADEAAAGGPAPGAVRAIVRSVFGDALAHGDARRLRLALRHAARLGLGAGMLGVLLRRDPTAFEAMAAAEWRLGRRAASIACPSIAAAPVVTLRLVPIDADPPRPWRDRPSATRAIDDAESHPWGRQTAVRASA